MTSRSRRSVIHAGVIDLCARAVDDEAKLTVGDKMMRASEALAYWRRLDQELQELVDGGADEAVGAKRAEVQFAKTRYHDAYAAAVRSFDVAADMEQGPGGVAHQFAGRVGISVEPSVAITVASASAPHTALR